LEKGEILFLGAGKNFHVEAKAKVEAEVKVKAESRDARSCISQ